MGTAAAFYRHRACGNRDIGHGRYYAFYVGIVRPRDASSSACRCPPHMRALGGEEWGGGDWAVGIRVRGRGLVGFTNDPAWVLACRRPRAGEGGDAPLLLVHVLAGGPPTVAAGVHHETEITSVRFGIGENEVCWQPLMPTKGHLTRRHLQGQPPRFGLGSRARRGGRPTRWPPPYRHALKHGGQGLGEAASYRMIRCDTGEGNREYAAARHARAGGSVIWATTRRAGARAQPDHLGRWGPPA